MRLPQIGVAVLFILTLAAAQQPPAPRPPKLFASAADVQALMDAAIKNRTPAQLIVNQPIISLAPHTATLEYRPAPGVNPAAIHPTEDEFFYVMNGTATLVTGGTIASGKIEGGTPQKLAKGDFAMVPANTNHWFTEVSDNFFDMSMHLPRPAPPAAPK